MSKERVGRLEKYANDLRQRLAGKVPAKYAANPEPFIQMLQIDLNKTLLKIEELKK